MNKNIFFTAERKRVIENFFSLSLIKAITMLLPLLIIPHLVLTLGLDSVGRIALITVIVAYFHTLIDYGFTYTGAREVAKNNSIDDYTNILMIITCCKLIFIFFSIFVLVILSFLIGFINDNLMLILLGIIHVSVLSLTPTWFFQGLERMKNIAISDVFGKILSFFMILLLVKEPSDIYMVFISYISGQLFSMAIYIYFLKPYVRFSGVIYPNVLIIKERLYQSWDMFLNLLFPNFYNGYSYLVLGYFGTLAHVAIYDIARKIMNISEQAVGVISQVYYPILSKNIMKFKEFLLVLIVFSFVLSFGQLLFGIYGVGFLFNDKTDAIKKLTYLQMAVPLVYGLMLAYGINFLGTLGQDRKLRKITIFSSILGFFVVTILTYFYLVIGALIGILLTWMFRTVLCYITSKQILNFSKV